MKHYIVLAACVLIGTGAAAQTSGTQKPLTPAQKRTADLRKNAVGGYIRDARNRPYEGVQAFIYSTDSAAGIMASGYSDAMGHYETNSVMPGKYNIKYVYPSTNKAIMVPDVMLKRGVTEINVKAETPAADTSIPYAVFAPPPPVKEKVKIKR